MSSFHKFDCLDAIRRAPTKEDLMWVAECVRNRVKDGRLIGEERKFLVHAFQSQMSKITESGDG